MSLPIKVNAFIDAAEELAPASRIWGAAVKDMVVFESVLNLMRKNGTEPERIEAMEHKIESAKKVVMQQEFIISEVLLKLNPAWEEAIEK